MSIDFKKLILRLGKRDAKAYKELFDRFFEHSYCLAMTYVVDPDVANDIVQEVFISIYDHSSDLNSIDNLPGYITVAVRNRCLNYLRDLDLEDRNLHLYYEHLLTAPLDDDNDNLKELIAKIEQEMPSLPESCRVICEMRFRRGMKIKDIASELDLAVGTVKVQLHRAVIKIKSNLKNF